MNVSLKITKPAVIVYPPLIFEGMHYFISLFPFIPPPHLHSVVVILSSFVLAEQVSSAKYFCLLITKPMVLMLTGDWLFLSCLCCS